MWRQSNYRGKAWPGRGRQGELLEDGACEDWALTRPGEQGCSHPGQGTWRFPETGNEEEDGKGKKPSGGMWGVNSRNPDVRRCEDRSAHLLWDRPDVPFTLRDGRGLTPESNMTGFHF